MKRIQQIKEHIIIKYLLLLLLLTNDLYSQIVIVPVSYGSFQMVETDFTSVWKRVENSMNNSIIYFVDTAANNYFMCKVFNDSIPIPLSLIDTKSIIILQYKHRYYASSEIILKSHFFNREGWIFYLKEKDKCCANNNHFSIVQKGTLFDFGSITYQKASVYNRYGKKIVNKVKKRGNLINVDKNLIYKISDIEDE